MDFIAISHIAATLQEHTVLLGSIFTTAASILIIRELLSGGWCKSKTLLHGKTVIVTGANAGIGKEIARDLVKRGARVILACRNLDKAVLAAREIEAESKGEVVVRHLDLSSFKSIRKFAEDVLTTEKQINILINNAGVLVPKQKTEDGNDLLFQTNHLGPFLLTHLLMARLKDSTPARIINVTSMAHQAGIMNWDDLNYNKPGKYQTITAYSQSKLANIYFSRELASRIKNTGVSVYAAHPGYVQTQSSDDFILFLPVVLRPIVSIIRRVFAKSAAQGAQTIIHCAVSEDVADQSGLYYGHCREISPAAISKDKEAARRLWDISVEMVKLKEEEMIKLPEED